MAYSLGCATRIARQAVPLDSPEILAALASGRQVVIVLSRDADPGILPEGWRIERARPKARRLLVGTP